MRDESGISTYPVGLLDAYLKGRLTHYIRHYMIGYCVKQKKWGALRNCFNGYLAEWHFPPQDPRFRHALRCGRGITRERARRNLGKHIVEANRASYEKD